MQRVLRELTSIKILVVLGLVAVFCMSSFGREFALRMAFTIIGIPISLLMALTPTLFVVTFLLRLFREGLALIGMRSWLMSALMTFGLLTAIPWLINSNQEAAAENMVSGDRNQIGPIMPLETLAVVTPRSPDQGTDCDMFCRGALLSGAVRNILMIATTRQQTEQPNDELAGMMYSLDEGPTCPTPKPVTASSSKWYTEALKTHKLVCLVARRASIAKADAILTGGKIVEGKTDCAAGFNLLASTIDAWRMSLFLRENGQLVERYRSTGVRHHKLLPLLLLSYTASYGKGGPGFVRYRTYKGVANTRDLIPPMTTFGRKFLQIDQFWRNRKQKLLLTN